jgi:hypothetical protein
MILFVLDSFGVKFEAFELVSMGLAFLALHLIVGNWPLGYISRSRT